MIARGLRHGLLVAVAAPWVVLAGGNAPAAPPCTVSTPPPTASIAGHPAPNLAFHYGRGVYLITASELAAAGVRSGTAIERIGWIYDNAPSLTDSALLRVYLQNTLQTTNDKSTTWTFAITDMTLVHNAVTPFPASAGPWDIWFSGGSPFIYTGNALFVAFEQQYPPSNPSLSNAVLVRVNEDGLANGFLGQHDDFGPPSTLEYSNARPQTRFLDTCNDDLSCTVDTCAQGQACTHTLAPFCNDNDPCTTDSCDASTDQCRHEAACDDGNACTLDACAGGACGHQALNGVSCDDSNPCTLQDECVQGLCTGTPLNCADGNPCTTDVCAGGQCTHPAACDDGISCTHDTCDPATGACQHVADYHLCPPPGSCNQYVCDPTLGCRSIPVNSGSCDTGGNHCWSGRCRGGNCEVVSETTCGYPYNCGASTCDPATGQCVNNDNVCVDGNPCTQDNCFFGACPHLPIDCNDGVGCTNDSCSPQSGCVHTPTVAGEIGAVRFLTKTDFEWDPPARFYEGDSYQVLRGDLGAFPVGGAASVPTELCYGTTSVTFQSFPDTPAPGAGYWVLIRAKSVCGTASYGQQVLPGGAWTERSSSTCP